MAQHKPDAARAAGFANGVSTLGRYVPMSAWQTPAEVLTAIITPAVLISASGMLVLSTTQRLARVIDRSRSFTDTTLTPAGPDAPHTPRQEAGHRMIADQLGLLSHRVRLLNVAITTLFVAIGLFVATSFAIGICAWLQSLYEWIPVIFEMAGVGTLLFTSVILIREARLQVSATLRELAMVHNSLGDGGTPPHA
jgi:hypothetical protein